MPPTARDERIEAHLPLVYALARRFGWTGEPLDDLVQAGCEGLIRAADRFDAGRGHAFEAYAVPTIVGEIRRHVRDRAAIVRVPRRASEQHGRARSVRRELEARGRRTPRAAEVALAAGLPVDAVRRALAPLQVEQLDDRHAGVSAPGPFPELDDRLALIAALRRLPLRERRVLLLHFYADLSQRAIGGELGLSQVQVSRAMRSGLARLRTTLQDDPAVARSGQEA